MKIILILPLYVLVLAGCSQMGPSRGVVPKEGFVPNETVALAIADAVLKPVYGKETIESELPFTARAEGERLDHNRLSSV